MSLRAYGGCEHAVLELDRRIAARHPEHIAEDADDHHDDLDRVLEVLEEEGEAGGHLSRQQEGSNGRSAEELMASAAGSADETMAGAGFELRLCG